MCVNSLYSYPYLNYQKLLVLPIIAYTLSSTKFRDKGKIVSAWYRGGGGGEEGGGG
jgi:hypothetical protein